MAKYFCTWEVDMSKLPTDPKELMGMQMKMLENTKQGLDTGQMIDWGSFVGEFKGYGIAEGTAKDMAKATAQFAPYVIFNFKEVLSVDEVLETIKSMM